MKVIGITGGVGAGKSRVLALLEEEFGAGIILADEVARQLQEPGQPGFVRLLEYFGDGILGEDGRLDRAGLAARIFRDQEALEAVNRMIHPLVWQTIQKMAADFGRPPAAGETVLGDQGAGPQGAGASPAAGGTTPGGQGTGPQGAGVSLVAVESALFDRESRSLCQELWFIDTSDENRISRLMAGRGYTRERCVSIIKNQKSREEFLAFCDVVIDNNGSLDQVRRQIRRQVERLEAPVSGTN